MDRTKLKQSAKQCLSGNSKLYLIYLLFFVVLLLCSYIPVIQSVSFIINIFLMFMMISITFNVAKGNPVDINVSSTYLGRYLLSYLLQFLINLLPSIFMTMAASAAIFSILSSVWSAELFSPGIDPAMGVIPYNFIIISFILGVIGFIAAIFISLLLFPVAYLSIDESFEGRATDCICTAVKMMKGKKMELFILQLSFIPWLLLCIITCGIAFIYVAPYMQLTYCKYYLQLKESND